MSQRFDRCVEVVLKHEGGFVDDPHDPGGATNHGISLRYARTQGSMLDIDGDGDVDRDDIVRVTKEKAALVYRNWFWRDVKGDEMPAGLDLALFDYAVNSGAGRAIRALQKVLGTQQDGVIGPITMDLVKKTSVFEMVSKLTDERMRFLRSLGTWGRFGRGWTRRVYDVKERAVEMIGDPQMTIREAVTQTNTGPGAAVVAGAGAVATAVSQIEPVIKTLGSMTPWVALALIVASLVGVYLWRTRRI